MTRRFLRPCHADGHAWRTSGVEAARSRQESIAEFNLPYPAYLDLFTPAVDWILQCVAHSATKDTLRTILDKYTEHCKDALVLDSVMTSFPPEYVAEHAVLFTELIRSADATAYPLVRIPTSIPRCCGHFAHSKLARTFHPFHVATTTRPSHRPCAIRAHAAGAPLTSTRCTTRSA